MPKKTTKPCVKGSMKVNAYNVLSRAVEEGIERGWNRSHKHSDNPADQTIKDTMEQEVMSAVCEVFEFDHE